MDLELEMAIFKTVDIKDKEGVTIKVVILIEVDTAA